MDAFMKRAVELSGKNVREGGTPFGAVLVRDGKVIEEAVNEYHQTYDVSGHAELLAVRRAQQKLQTDDLSGYVMYASGEPCPMCYTAMAYVGIDQCYYCASTEDASRVGLGEAEKIYQDLHKPKDQRSPAMIHMPLEAGQEDPTKEWGEKHND